MSKFASQTTVSVANSRAEIEKEITRFGASGFASGWQDNRSLIEFIYKNKKIRFILEVPPRPEFNKANRKIRGLWTERHGDEAWEQAKRQRWRALALIVKAKLVAVADGVTTFETEFMPHIVMPDDRTVAEHVMPEMDRAFISGVTPKLLTAGSPQ